LTLTENTPDRVRFTLSDEMDDAIYDYPLTVKVRMYDHWQAAAATQGGAPLEVTTVENGGATFALVKAVPDRGEVVVIPTSPDLAVTAWLSVQAHGPAGDVETPMGDGHVDPRIVGPGTLRIAFNAALDPATATAAAVTLVGQTAGDLSSIVQSVTVGGVGNQTLTVQLASPLADGDRYTLTVTDVLRDTEGRAVTGDVTLAFACLAGDADGSGTVTTADILAVRSQAGQPCDAATARYDLDCGGAISGADLLTARSRFGATLP
jgi:hypothetical protein